MKRPRRDDAREKRIDLEILIEAYDEQERAMGWYYYLEENLTFPFRATCNGERPSSPLQTGDTIEVIGLADADECTREIIVEIASTTDHDQPLTVPLSQLDGVGVDAQAQQAIEDWHYWVARGYGF
ncbi:calcium-binding protein [candidate division KSB3 bacterium]|uniref:Calcium-binding protein n=1 Tax=candidate division KSB3 bacterium TaxID=2044937 RepID=A0A9D5JUI8_9BACT|nr:calcium-binding protein [candidate division KSB3 bacterium]MBD3324379.1 calcium-binding protein [candidate division KSB3 bacterium]